MQPGNAEEKHEIDGAVSFRSSLLSATRDPRLTIHRVALSDCWDEKVVNELGARDGSSSVVRKGSFSTQSGAFRQERRK